MSRGSGYTVGFWDYSFGLTVWGLGLKGLASIHAFRVLGIAWINALGGPSLRSTKIQVLKKLVYVCMGWEDEDREREGLGLYRFLKLWFEVWI